jgi:hypothetical protein
MYTYTIRFPNSSKFVAPFDRNRIIIHEKMYTFYMHIYIPTVNIEWVLVNLSESVAHLNRAKIFIYIYIYVYIYISIYIHIYTLTHMHKCIPTVNIEWVLVNLSESVAHLSKSQDFHIYLHICIYIYIYIYVYKHIHTSIYMYIRPYVYLNIYLL